MAIEIGLGQTALNDTATVDFTSAQLSQAPVACLTFVGDGGSNGTADDDVRIGTGATDGTREFVQIGELVHGSASVDARRNFVGNAGARAPDGSIQDFLSHDSFLSNGSNGWRAGHTERSDVGKLALAAMFGGSDVTAEVGKVTLSGTSQITKSLNNTSLTPNVIIFFTDCNDESSGASSFFVPTYGIAYDNGTSITQRGITWHDEDGAASANPIQYISTSWCVAQTANGSATHPWTMACDSMSAGQFKVTPSANAGGDDVGFLALQIDNANIALVDIDTPTSTGVNEQTGPGFTPSFVMQVLTMMTAADTFDSSAKAGALAFSLFNDSEEFCYSWANEDAAATTNTQSLTHNRAVYYDADDGTLAFDGVFNAFTANGWEINYSTVDGTSRKGFALAIGAAGGGNTGTAAQTLPAVTQSATGIMTFSATADQTLASLTQSASGSTLSGNTGTIAQSLPAITQSADGSLQFSGTSSQMLAAITQSASGGLTFTGTAAQTLASIVQSASGEVGRVATISQTLPVITQDGSGELSFSSTSSQILPAITQSARESEEAEVVGPPGSMFTSKGSSIKVSFKKSRFRK